jgi:TolB-like protein/tetratricopeptide (TPR) repeat protein
LNLFNELKRRNVFKVGAAYLVVGWLVIQAADLLAPQLNLPEWAPRLVTFLVLIGFPLALVLAWIFDLTAEGLQREQGHVANKRFYATIGLLTVLALGWFFAGQRGESPAPPRGPAPVADAVPPTAGPAGQPPSSTSAPADPPVAPAVDELPSVAVLPFVNMSPDPDNEFFADGISEELLNILARIPGLKVASRTSAFSFKGSTTPIPAIATTLQVGHVLEGSVRKQGDRVRITAQLIHAQSDAHLWSDTYDRNLTDIFKVQEEIAQSIATALEDVLGARRVEVIAPTRDLEAYQRFLQGRSRFFQRTDLDDALADLQFAVQRDPEFAEAWALLAATALVHANSRYPTQLDRATIHMLINPAADRALALNPDMPLVLAVKGYSLMDARDPAPLREGLAMMERAAATELGDSTARMWLGLHWLQLGWIDRAVPVLESAYESDPLVAINVGYLGIARFLSGNDAEGERLARRALELSGWPAAAVFVALEYANRGEMDRSTTWLEVRSSMSPREQLVDRINDIELHVAKGDANALFGALQTELTWIEGLWVSLAAWLPSTTWLREDPRFYALMEQRGHVGLWEISGYPLDCRPVDDPAGRRLECNEGN